MAGFKTFLKEIVNEIFEAAFDIDICGFSTEEDLATKARMSTSTVNKLRRGITKEPRLSTIYKLAKAIKMDVHLLDEALTKGFGSWRQAKKPSSKFSRSSKGTCRAKKQPDA